jgi:hypothetical protein
MIDVRVTDTDAKSNLSKDLGPGNSRKEKKESCATSSFHSVRGLHRWPHRQGSENLAEEAVHPLVQ